MKLSKQLQGVLGEIQAAVGVREKVVAAISKAESELAAADSRYSEISGRVAQREAALALGEQVEAVPGLDRLEGSRRDLRLRISGLVDRQAQADDTLRLLRERLTMVSAAMAQEQLSGLAREWKTAAETLVGVVQRMTAIESLLVGRGDFFVELRELNLANPLDINDRVIGWPSAYVAEESHWQLLAIDQLPGVKDIAATLRPVVEASAQLAQLCGRTR